MATTEVNLIGSLEPGTFDQNGNDYDRAGCLRTSRIPAYNRQIQIYASSASGTALQVVMCGWDSSGALSDYLGTWTDTGEKITISGKTAEIKIALRYANNANIEPEDVTSCIAVFSAGWVIREDELTRDDFLEPPEKYMTKPYPALLWRIDGVTQSGFPYHEMLPDLEVNTFRPVYQPEYITVYDMHTKQDQFDTHGLAVLSPTQCLETEELNGGWTVQLVHPIDNFGKWQYLIERNLLKVGGQIFTIISVEHSYTGNSGQVSVTAEHVFYQQNDSFIFRWSRITGDTGEAILNSMDANTTRFPEPGQTLYTYSHTSNVKVPSGASTNAWNPVQGGGITPVELLMGNSGLLELTNGELYRDNFYYSINETMENSKTNAFEISVGFNLKGIKRTIDTTTFCAHFECYDHYGSMFGVAYVWSSTALQFPHSVIRAQYFDFYIDEDTLPEGWDENTKLDISMDLLVANGMAYFRSHCTPLVSYVVDIQDTKNNPDFKELSNHPRYKVGDTGIVHDDRLGGYLELRISKTVIDRVKDEIAQVYFGDLRSFTRPAGYKSAIVGLREHIEIIAAQIRDKSGNLVFDKSGNKIMQRRYVNE